jgi:HEPN domain-containing protein
MQPPDPRREAQEWLLRADRDLMAAGNELASTPPLYEMTAYHAQQAAEKALKAFLARHSVPFRMTHDLTILLPECERVDPAFAQHTPAAAQLTPYATLFRYPGGPVAPPEAEARQALQLASQVVSFVRTRV